MRDRLLRLLTDPSNKWGNPNSRRVPLRVELLEDRLTPSTSTAFNGSVLNITINTGDDVTITENSPGNFTVSDATNTNINGAGPGAFDDVQSINVNVTASGAKVEAVGLEYLTGPALTGNFTVRDTQADNALTVGIFAGFSVGNGISISNTGAGSYFAYNNIPGVFIDANNLATDGSVNIQGSGNVEFDGLNVRGGVTVNLGSSGSSSFRIDSETVFDSLTTLNQNPTTIGGNLTVTGGMDTELYNTKVGGKVSITETTSTGSCTDYVILGNVTISKGLTINTPSANGTTGVFIDFSSISGPTSITEGSGLNAIGLQSDSFLGSVTLNQGPGTDYLFIDSECALNSAYYSNYSLPNDFGYTDALDDAYVLPSDTGSTFNANVTAKQGAGVHELQIGQDYGAVTTFTKPSSFTAGPGTTTDLDVSTSGIPPHINGY